MRRHRPRCTAAESDRAGASRLLDCSRGGQYRLDRRRDRVGACKAKVVIPCPARHADRIGVRPCPLSPVPCPLSPVPCPLSPVPCPLSPVPCPLSPVT